MWVVLRINSVLCVYRDEQVSLLAAAQVTFVPPPEGKIWSRGMVAGVSSPLALEHGLLLYCVACSDDSGVGGGIRRLRWDGGWGGRSLLEQEKRKRTGGS